MEVRIKETNEVKELILTNPKDGSEWTEEYIHYGDFADIEYDSDAAHYIMSQDTYDWWSKVIADQQVVDDRVHDLTNVHGAAAVERVTDQAYLCDLEDQPARVHAALDEAFGKCES